MREARQGGIIEPTATGVPGKPVCGLLGQVSGGYGEKKFKPRFSGAAHPGGYKASGSMPCFFSNARYSCSNVILR